MALLFLHSLQWFQQHLENLALAHITCITVHQCCYLCLICKDFANHFCTSLSDFVEYKPFLIVTMILFKVNCYMLLLYLLLILFTLLNYCVFALLLVKFSPVMVMGLFANCKYMYFSII